LFLCSLSHFRVLFGFSKNYTISKCGTFFCYSFVSEPFQWNVSVAFRRALHLPPDAYTVLKITSQGFDNFSGYRLGGSNHFTIIVSVCRMIGGNGKCTENCVLCGISLLWPKAPLTDMHITVRETALTYIHTCKYRTCPK
jgi:hypothetical protein